jgi:hypothetical protein
LKASIAVSAEVQEVAYAETPLRFLVDFNDGNRRITSRCRIEAYHPMTPNRQLLLEAHDGSGWRAPLACRIVDDGPQQNGRR